MLRRSRLLSPVSCLLLVFAPALLPAENLLSTSKSPYLLQHADNPVNWRPWGDEAFALAKSKNLPVFLSIGYSTCHWCHVMAHESFEDEETAAFLNKHFIAIKVDREERPDVDRIYMNYQQAVHGSGGWPLSLWLTADRVPFFSGTYFPKTSRLGGPPTFLSMLERIRETWELHDKEITADSTRILDGLRQHLTATPPANPDAPSPDAALPARGAADLAKIFDTANGGFGSRPKFPQPLDLGFLLEHAATLPPDDPTRTLARTMVETTLDHMAAGGIHDHLGGGFHRYSVEDTWHVPHFEKMLYDQAQIASAFLDAYHLTRNTRHADTARDIFTYVERDLSHSEGAFYSAEDADSEVPANHRESAAAPDPHHAEKKEGAFYLWTVAEVETLLGPEDAPIFIAAYDMRPGGNAPPGSDPFNEFTGKNILFKKKGAAGLAKTFQKPEAGIEASLAASREKLLLVRSERPRPHLDDKILTAWNGLMISAYAKAHLVLGEKEYLQRAIAAATFIKDNLYNPKTKTLLRSWREGPSAANGTADDYAYFIQALLDVYEASLDIQWLQLALELQDRQVELLHDDEHGGFFDSPATQSDLILRLKSSHDGARPSANAVSALNLVRLGALVKSDRYDTVLDSLFKYFGTQLAAAPASHAALLTAWARRLETPAQVVITGEADDPATGAILDQVRAPYLPNKVILLLPPAGLAREFLDARNPLFAAFKPIEGRPTLYLCQGFTCQKPTSDLKEIKAQLAALQP